MKRNKYKERPLNFISNVTQKNIYKVLKLNLLRNFCSISCFKKNPQNDKKM